MLQVNIREAKNNFSQWLDRAVEGEEIVILKNDRPVAKLMPLNGNRPKRKLGAAKGKIKMANDFDAPLDDFKE